MDICGENMPAGVNINCLAALAQIKNAIILKSGTKFNSISEFINLVNWKSKIQEDLTVYAAAGLYDYEVTTDDPNVKTTGLGQKIVTSTPSPSGTFYLDANFCDYQNLLNVLKGGTYDIVYVLNDETLLAHYNADGSITGFKAKLNAITKGLPQKDDIDMNFIVYINHQSYSQFQSGVLQLPAWKPTIEIPLAMPLGYSFGVTVPYETTGGTVKVYVAERCGSPVLGLDDPITNWEIIETSNLDTPSVTTVVDDGYGHYTLTLEQGIVPDPLASGDWIVLQIKVLDTTIVEAISNQLLISA